MKNKLYSSIFILFLLGFSNNCFADSVPNLDNIIINNTITVNSWSSIEESTIRVNANENVYLTWTYLNCNRSDDSTIDENPVINWYNSSETLIWTWDTINIQTSYSWSYYATLYCQGISFNSLGFNIEIKDPTVNAWTNTNYNSWDTVNLSGSITWTDSSCTAFDYQWEQVSWPTVEIINSWANLVSSKSYTGASFVFPNTTENIVLRLNVTPESCANAWNTYSGTVTYSKYSQTWWWWWGSSYSSRMRREAENLFYDTGSIEKILLNLKLEKQNYSPILRFYWDSIWWNWQVNYILEYSTWNDFSTWNTKIFNTKESFY